MSSGDIAIRLIMGLIVHGLGDYVIQSDWMATEKTKRWWPAVAHGVTYAVPFSFLVVPSSGSIPVALVALAVIGGTHIVLDRFRLARHVIWAKNLLLGPSSHRRLWSECRATGFPPDRPVWLTTWLMIIVDNIIHILINTLVIIWAANQ